MRSAMNNCIHTLTDAFALTSSVLGKGNIDPQQNTVADNVHFNIWVIEQNGCRTLVRENVAPQLSAALVSSANHGARVQGHSHTYEAVPLPQTERCAPAR